jgi:hypothetical protein
MDFWWAVAQHYGGVTRVLDWTQKIGVSVYFATSNNLDTGSPVRMSVQSGFFTSCTNVLHDHETVIRDRYAGALRKHIIPRESKPQLLREATMRGFSGAALFFDSSEKAGYAQRDEIVPNFQGWLVPCDLTGGKNGGKEIADYDPKNIRSDGIRT